MVSNEKVKAYEAGINNNHYGNIREAMSACEKLGDGNYRVTLDTTPGCTHSIEVRNGEAEYC